MNVTEKYYRNAVTAIIPCYNDGGNIQEALDSLVTQTVLPDKIIIIDDGSDKETLEILKNIENPLVEIIFQENCGVCVARNVGIFKAQTSYILTLDADDRFEPEFIEKAVHILFKNNAVGVVCCYYKEFGSGSVNPDVIMPKGGSARDFLVKNNGLGNALFRKQCWEEVKGYDVAFKKGYEDWDFWLSILKNNWTMEVIKEPLFWYRKKLFSRDTMAVFKYDYELRIQLFEKHRDVYLENFDTFTRQVIYKNIDTKRQLKKTKDTLDYRLGHTILNPLRRIKKLFS